MVIVRGENQLAGEVHLRAHHDDGRHGSSASAATSAQVRALPWGRHHEEHAFTSGDQLTAMAIATVVLPLPPFWPHSAISMALC
jgi:hypothetical protein